MLENSSQIPLNNSMDVKRASISPSTEVSSVQSSFSIVFIEAEKAGSFESYIIVGLHLLIHLIGFPLTAEFTEMDQKDVLQRLYGLSVITAVSTIWE